MTQPCPKWKDPMLDAALTGVVPRDLEQHVTSCDSCGRELARLQTRQAQLDTLLPLMAGEAEPHPQFHARVMGAAATAGGKKRRMQIMMTPIWVPVAGGAIAVAVLAALMIAHPWRSSTISNSELAAATALANWRAPSDVLLETPGREFLRTTPRLGESYINFSVKPNKEKTK